MHGLKFDDLLFYWITAFLIGFQFWQRIPQRIRKLLFWLSVLSLFGGAMVTNATHGELQQPSMRVLTHVASQPVIHTVPPLSRTEVSQIKQVAANFHTEVRLRQEEANRQAVTKQHAIADIAIKRANVENNMDSFRLLDTTFERKGTRKGPFCRITCLVHHNNTYDVEVDKELCQANWVPPTAEWVPGWETANTDSSYEYRNPWPGPAQHGFHSYRLYWK